MNQDVEQTESEHRCGGKCKSGRAKRLGLFAVLLVGAGIVGATFIGNSFAGGWHHSKHMRTMEDAEERARDASAWIAGVVDASGPQQAQIETVLSGLAGRLYPLTEAHRDNRRQLITEVSRSDVQRESLESLRQAELALADQASTAILDAFLEVSAVLEPEQRQHLSALASHFKGRMRHRSHP